MNNYAGFALPLMLVFLFPVGLGESRTQQSVTIDFASPTGMRKANLMSTRETIEGYFNCLKEGKRWESFFDEDVVFTSFTSPIKRIAGKVSFIEATTRFYSTVRVVDVRDLLVDGEKACALTHYELQPPGGKSITTDVSEIFTVRNARIVSFDIYFDSVPFPK